MKAISRVIRNSMWNVIQPLILNLISISVMGYVARTLGQEDYGRFIFAFSFITLFMPITSLGLRAITVRDIAANPNQADGLLGEMLILRLVLSFLTFLFLVIVVNLLGYPPATKGVVYLAGITLFFLSGATTFFDAFQAYERMELIAYANFVSGSIQTALSVIVLLMGYRLMALTFIYLVGSALLFLNSLFLYHKGPFPALKFRVDISSWQGQIREAFPFFILLLLFILRSNIGVVLLSKMAGTAPVGLYGAASKLIDVLSIIPDSVSTAIFPVMTYLYLESRREAEKLFERFFNYMLLLSLPIFIGTTLLSDGIIRLIYGEQYMNSGIILSVLACTVPLTFIDFYQTHSLLAIKLQTQVVKVSLVSTLILILLNLLLIPLLGEKGVALAIFGSSLFSVGFKLFYTGRHLSFKLNGDFISKVVAANVLMTGTVIVLRNYNLLLAIAGSALCYLFFLILFRVVNGEDWRFLKFSFAKRKTGPEILRVRES